MIKKHIEAIRKGFREFLKDMRSIPRRSLKEFLKDAVSLPRIGDDED